MTTAESRAVTTLGLVVNGGRDSGVSFASDLIDAARELGITALARSAEDDLDLPPWRDEVVDMVVAVGGDGTMLEAARQSIGIDRPVLGVNLGTLGFLAEAEPDQLGQMLTAVAAGHYTVEKRNTIVATMPDGTSGLGVNDVVAEKIDSQRLVALAVTFDSEPFITYRADGVVVATSTGSTAYAFSAGGPLLDPRVPALLVTPVAPHSLFDRTMVLPQTTTVGIAAASDRPVRVSVDGRELGALESDGTVVISPGERSAAFVRLGGESFPARVRRTFGPATR